MALTITRAANVYPNTARPDVHALSQGWCRNRRSHCASESRRDVLINTSCSFLFRSSDIRTRKERARSEGIVVPFKFGND